MAQVSTLIYVGFVGWCDIHCKFLSTFQGVCVTWRSVCINFHASCSPMAHTRCVNYAFCIIFEWYFVLVFCLCFVYKFSPSMESVYWFHSPPCICACLVLCLLICQVGSWWTFCQVWSALQVISVANQNL